MFGLLRRIRWVASLTVGALVFVLVAWLPGGVGLAEGEDPEPEVLEFPASNYDPGPGWPEGWEAPAPPEAIPDWVREDWEDGMQWVPPEERPDTLLLRVLNPMPDWTQEYPYAWRFEYSTCGRTTYAYAHPYPDTELVLEMTGVTFSVTTSLEPGCVFVPVASITEDHIPTGEELEQELLVSELTHDMDDSRGGRPGEGGLSLCSFVGHEGDVGNILVCFNGGDASRRFDAPAYLDVEVSRVRVPLRFVSEMMGGRVTWDEALRKVTIQFDAMQRDVVHPVSEEGFEPKDWWLPERYFPEADTYFLEEREVSQPQRTIEVTIDSEVALVDGQEVVLDAPPVIVDPGRTMVPLRFIAEQMEAKVYWVGSEPIFTQSDGSLSGTYQVHIFTPFHPYYEYPSWFLENRALKY